jgi:hypothetical protein
MRPIRPTWETISPQITTSGKSYTRATGLRALWTDWSVEVRVLSGALEKAPEIMRFRGDSEGDLERNA